MRSLISQRSGSPHEFMQTPAGMTFEEEMNSYVKGWKAPEDKPETEQDKIYKKYRKDLQWGREWS